MQQFHCLVYIHRNGNICPHKNLYMNVHRSSIPQQPKNRNNSNVHKLMNGQTKYGIIHVIKDYSFMKSNEVLINVTILINLENITLSKKS